MQLRQWRRRGIGPEYFQFTARTVSYSDDYLRDWFNDPRNAHLLAQDPPGHLGHVMPGWARPPEPASG